jgi:trehalose 6-phosphate synthase
MFTGAVQRQREVATAIGGGQRRPDRNSSQLWTAERLRGLLGTLFPGESIVVLANREPFSHTRAADGSIVVQRSAGGLVTALEPLLQACSGVWVAHGAGAADRAVVDRQDGVNVPPRDPAYRLRRVWLNQAEMQGYYLGFANEGLWALCHRARIDPVFRRRDFATYEAVNARFAAAVVNESRSDSPLVLVQDYHFALAPAIIRGQLPDSTIVSFWHIPWPRAVDFEVCPWGRRLVEGLLGSTIVGFQTSIDCRNFFDTVERMLPADVNRDQNTITWNGHRTSVCAYPVSVEWPNRWVNESPAVESCRESVRRELQLDPETLLGVGIDRLDYTKGIEDKFLAIERLLERSPAFRGRFVFAQIAEPSREQLPAYQQLRTRVLETCERINRRFGSGSYRPLILREMRHEPAEVFRFLRAADLCYVNSLHDGMNLVAKEFVCARDDERGVLLLSTFAGAAHQLAGALRVNPYAIDRSADAIGRALNMAPDEQTTRMRTMRSNVAECNTYWWAGQMLVDAARLRRRQRLNGAAPSLDQRIPA